MPARAADAVTGLASACHPLPCVAVTTFAVGYGMSVGLPAARLALLAAVVLAGQLSIGWCNDAVDAPRDAAAGRGDKPVANGLVGRGVVAGAAGAALVACVIASLALGVVPGLVHLVAVAAGWAYDLGLKSTAGSVLAYVVAFGALPAVATTALPHARWPAWTVVAGAALLGLAAHFANTVGDAEADAATGVRGLPQRIGPQRSLQVTALGVGTAALVLLAGVLEGSPAPRPIGVALLAGGSLSGGLGLALSTLRDRRTRDGAAGGALSGRRAAFRVTLAAVALVVLGLLTSTPVAALSGP